MYELELLGAVNLRREGHQLVRPPQPKRLALLCYLLLSKPRGYRSRDELLAMFWPESDHASGRASLRKAVHGLRKVLGARAIEGTGERLRACPERLSCDAIRFEQAIDDGRLQEAMQLYRGELLPGFHVSGIPAFERWLDMERLRLRRRALETAVRLADDAGAAGEAGEAGHWARRAVRVDPFDEATGRWAATLLTRLGQRTTAIRVLDLLVRRLEEEWEVAPTAATLDLVDSIRSAQAPSGTRAIGPTPPQPDPAVRAATAVPPVAPPRGGGAGTNRPAPDSPPATDPAPGIGPDRSRLLRWALIAAAVVTVIVLVPSLARQPPAANPAPDPAFVAVLAFESADSAASRSAAALNDLVTSSLASFAAFDVIDGSAVGDAAASIAAGDPSGAATAAAIGAATGATWIVRGRIASGERRLLASVDVWDGRRGAWTGPVRAEAGADSLVALADRLSARLVAGRLTAPGDLGYADLHEASTHSTAALREFFDGDRYFQRGQWPQAALRYWAALERDTAFAMAYFRLAETRGHMSRSDIAQLYRKALSFPQRLRARDRSLIRGALLNVQRRRAAVDTLRALTARHPFDAGAWNQLGAAYFHVGRRVLATPDDYRRALRRTIELDPRQVQPYLHLVEDAFVRQDERGARQLVQGLREVAGQTTYGAGFAVSLDLAWGNRNVRRRAIQALDTLSPRLRGPLARAMTVLELNPVYRDQLARVADARLRVTGSDAERDNTVGHLLRIYPRSGRAAAGLAILRSRMDMHGSRRNMARSILTWHTLGYRAPGYADEALAVLRTIDAPTVRERFWMGAWGLATGDSALFRKQLDELRKLAAVADSDPGAANGFASVSPPPYAGLVADGLEALADTGHDPERALASLKRAHDSRDPEITDDGILDYFRFRLGRLYRETRRFELALRHFRAQNHHADLYFALLELEQGRTLSAMGRHDDARVHYSRFAEWWAECDAGLRHLRDEALRDLDRIAKMAATTGAMDG